MSQADVLELLKKQKSPLTSKEITNLLNKGKRATLLNLQKLIKHGKIEKIKTNNKIKYKTKD